MFGFSGTHSTVGQQVLFDVGLIKQPCPDVVLAADGSQLCFKAEAICLQWHGRQGMSWSEHPLMIKLQQSYVLLSHLD